MEHSIACFTGHRPQHFPFRFNESDPACDRLKDQLWEGIKWAYNNGVRTFISGMALGVDQWAAELVIALKEQMGDVQLWAAIPCRGQDSVWNEFSRARYQRILHRCDKVIMVTDDSYNSACMDLRNRWMVDHSDLVIAVFTGKSGGTANCINYAESRRMYKPIEILNVLEVFKEV